MQKLVAKLLADETWMIWVVRNWYPTAGFWRYYAKHMRSSDMILPCFAVFQFSLYYTAACCTYIHIIEEPKRFKKKNTEASSDRMLKGMHISMLPLPVKSANCFLLLLVGRDDYPSIHPSFFFFLLKDSHSCTYVCGSPPALHYTDSQFLYFHSLNYLPTF